jgi:APA family basic amino acid/polyamine antiporter
MGASGPTVLALVVVVSVVASALALLLMAPRLYLAMGADGLFPEALSARHPRTGAPARATALLAAVASVFVLTGSFSQVVVLFMVPTLVFLALAAGGLFVVRRREPAASAFRAPGYPATPALFVALLALVVGLMAVARPAQALAGCLIVLTGLPVYCVFGARGATDAKGGAA